MRLTYIAGYAAPAIEYIANSTGQVIAVCVAGLIDECAIEHHKLPLPDDTDSAHKPAASL